MISVTVKYEKISCCGTAKEMWDKLDVTYEETDNVKETNSSNWLNHWKLCVMLAVWHWA